MTKWREALPFRQDLYASVSAVDADAEALTGEQRRVLELWTRDFRRAGQALAAEDRAELEAIRARLVELEIVFNRNVNEFEDGIEVTRAQLDGLPDEYVERLSPGAADGTYRVSLDYPEVYPYLSQASDRASRKALFDKHWSRATTENRPLLAEALRLRQRAAELLGYPELGALRHRGEDGRASGGGRGVLRHARAAPGGGTRPRARRPRRSAGCAISRGSSLAAWDWTYYDERIRRAEYGVDANLVAEYLPMEACLSRHVRAHRRGVRVGLPSSPRRAGLASIGRAVRDLGPSQRGAGRPLLRGLVPAARASSATPRHSPWSWAIAARTAPTRNRSAPSSPTSRRRPGDRPSARPAQRAGDALPRVRPHPPHVPDHGVLRADQRWRGRGRLRRGPVPDHGALDLGSVGPWTIRAALPDGRAHPAGARRADDRRSAAEHRREDHDPGLLRPARPRHPRRSGRARSRRGPAPGLRPRGAPLSRGHVPARPGSPTRWAATTRATTATCGPR